MDKMPKQWVSAHKQTEKALNYIKKSHQHLLHYLELHHVNDLYDLSQHYVPISQYQALKRQDLQGGHDADNQSEAVVGKATVQSDANQQHLKSLMDNLTSSSGHRHSKSNSASSQSTKKS